MRMIIANRLTDGLVVFYTADGDWTTDIAGGVVIGDESGEDRLFAAAKQDEEGCKVIDPNLIDVTIDGDAPKPVEIREAIRAFGPTV